VVTSVQASIQSQLGSGAANNGNATNKESKQVYIQPPSESRVKANSPNVSERLVTNRSAIDLAISEMCKGIRGNQGVGGLTAYEHLMYT
jgi:hypothetical protein